MEFLGEIWTWYWKHQPVFPFPYVCLFLGGVWAQLIANYLDAEAAGKPSEGHRGAVLRGFCLWLIAAWMGFMSGQWFFLVPLAAGAVVWFAIRLIQNICTSVGDSAPSDAANKNTAKSAADMDPKKVIRRATKLVEAFQSRLPKDSLHSVRESEFAGARLAALVKLYELLGRLDQLSLMDDIGFEAICREADSLFGNVALDRTAVKHYRQELPSFGTAKRSVKKAIETVYLGILNLPNTLPRDGIEIPVEYLRLQSPLEGDPLAGPMPDIVLPEPGISPSPDDAEERPLTTPRRLTA